MHDSKLSLLMRYLDITLPDELIDFVVSPYFKRVSMNFCFLQG